jgi:hypothetical protein
MKKEKPVFLKLKKGKTILIFFLFFCINFCYFIFFNNFLVFILF